MLDEASAELTERRLDQEIGETQALNRDLLFHFQGRDYWVLFRIPIYPGAFIGFEFWL
jgi:hypothetical protein